MKTNFSDGLLFEAPTVLVSLPFFYAVSTRLPFIALAVQAVQDGYSPIAISSFLAAYQMARALNSALLGCITNQLNYSILACSIGTAGYGLNAFFDKSSDFYPNVFLGGFIVVGLTEIMACLSTELCNKFSSKDSLCLRKCLRIQYNFVNFGAAFAFGVGGVIYAFHGIKALAAFGFSSNLMTLICLVSLKVAKKNEIAKEGKQEKDIKKECEEEDMSNTSLGLNKKQEWFKMQILLSVTYGIESLPHSTLITIGPVFLTEVYGKSTLYFGLLMFIGEITGTLFNIGKHVFSDTYKKIVPNPITILSCFAILSVSNIVFVIPASRGGLYFCAAGQILIQMTNDVASSTLLEMQGSTLQTKSVHGFSGLSNFSRRLINSIISFINPLLYFNVGYKWPFVLAGTLAFLWLVVLWYAFKLDIKAKENVIRDRSQAQNEKLDADEDIDMVLTKVKRLSWISLTRESSVNIPDDGDDNVLIELVEKKKK